MARGQRINELPHHLQNCVASKMSGLDFVHTCNVFVLCNADQLVVGLGDVLPQSRVVTSGCSATFFRHGNTHAGYLYER